MATTTPTVMLNMTVTTNKVHLYFLYFILITDELGTLSCFYVMEVLTMTTRCQHRHVNNDATTTPTPHHVKMQDGRFTTHPTCRRTKHASSPQHTTTTRSSMTPPLPPLHFEARDGVQSPWRGRAY
jgi:hypothetical protein